MVILIGHFLGLACRPIDLTIALFVGFSFRGTPILARGIGVARLWWFGFFVFVFGFVHGQLLCQCALLVTRLGLMPCSAWSKKNMDKPGTDDVVLTA